jgi:hypothetical protein
MMGLIQAIMLAAAASMPVYSGPIFNVSSYPAGLAARRSPAKRARHLRRMGRRS